MYHILLFGTRTSTDFDSFLYFFFLHSSCVQFQAGRWFYILYYLFGKFLKRSGLSPVEFFSVI